MRIEIHREEGLTILSINGQFDMYDTPEFESAFLRQLDLNTPVIAIMMNECTYIDSAAINTLIRCMNTAGVNETEMLLYALNDNIMKIFRTAKIDNYFKILSKEQFLKRFAGV
jgi:anti-anti-sigma factor